MSVSTLRFSYETDDGISRSEKEEAGVVTGSYKYSAPTNELVSVTYVAGENGYRPRVIVQYRKAIPVPIPEFQRPAAVPAVTTAPLPVICSLLGGC